MSDLRPGRYDDPDDYEMPPATEAKMLKPIEDMTEPELKALTNDICSAVKSRLPVNTAFMVLFWPFGDHGISQYGSNARREDMIKALREAADRLEKRQDVPR